MDAVSAEVNANDFSELILPNSKQNILNYLNHHLFAEDDLETNVIKFAAEFFSNENLFKWFPKLHEKSSLSNLMVFVAINDAIEDFHLKKTLEVYDKSRKFMKKIDEIVFSATFQFDF